MTDRAEKIALFDMDGTLCDYEGSLKEHMLSLQAPEEEIFSEMEHENSPVYLKNRANLIQKDIEWWVNLPKLKLGFDIWHLVAKHGYRRMILTQGPRKNPSAWSGKKIWIDRHFGPDVDITITRDKGLVYGKILVDDYPEYIERWLKWRPRGLVIMPANKNNAKFKHPQVIRYDGKNYSEVVKAVKPL